MSTFPTPSEAIGSALAKAGTRWHFAAVLWAKLPTGAVERIRWRGRASWHPQQAEQGRALLRALCERGGLAYRSEDAS